MCVCVVGLRVVCAVGCTPFVLCEYFGRCQCVLCFVAHRCNCNSHIPPFLFNVCRKLAGELFSSRNFMLFSGLNLIQIFNCCKYGGREFAILRWLFVCVGSFCGVCFLPLPPLHTHSLTHSHIHRCTAFNNTFFRTLLDHTLVDSTSSSFRAGIVAASYIIPHLNVRVFVGLYAYVYAG